MDLLEWLQHPYPVTLVRWLLGTTFLVAATSKFVDRSRFAQTILAYDVLPRRLAYIFARWLPWIEGVIGLTLVLGLVTKATAVLGSVLLFSFTVAIAINLARGRTHLDCGCFGLGDRQQISAKVLIRNILLVTLSFYVAACANGYFELGSLLFGGRIQSTDRPPIEGLLGITIISIGALMLYLLGKQLTVLIRRYRT